MLLKTGTLTMGQTEFIKNYYVRLVRGLDHINFGETYYLLNSYLKNQLNFNDLMGY